MLQTSKAYLKISTNNRLSNIHSEKMIKIYIIILYNKTNRAISCTIYPFGCCDDGIV